MPPNLSGGPRGWEWELYRHPEPQPFINLGLLILPLFSVPPGGNAGAGGNHLGSEGPTLRAKGTMCLLLRGLTEMPRAPVGSWGLARDTALTGGQLMSASIVHPSSSAIAVFQTLQGSIPPPARLLCRPPKYLLLLEQHRDGAGQGRSEKDSLLED